MMRELKKGLFGGVMSLVQPEDAWEGGEDWLEKGQGINLGKRKEAGGRKGDGGGVEGALADGKERKKRRTEGWKERVEVMLEVCTAVSKHVSSSCRRVGEGEEKEKGGKRVKLQFEPRSLTRVGPPFLSFSSTRSSFSPTLSAPNPTPPPSTPPVRLESKRSSRETSSTTQTISLLERTSRDLRERCLEM